MLKDEATWEEAKRESHQAGVLQGKAAGLREGHDAGLREGREEALRVARQAVVDLCEVLGLGLSAEQQADLAGRDQRSLTAAT